MRDLNFSTTNCAKYDLLILGSGLAGLRAAISALKKSPDLNIAIVSAHPGPCGSSFKNINKALGMQVCFNSKDKELLEQEVLSLAWPGKVNPELVKILAQESALRFQDLKEWGFEFRKNKDSSLQLHPGCFSPNYKRAVILEDLDQGYLKLLKKLSQKVDFLKGWTAVKLLTEQGNQNSKAVGALLQQRNNQDTLFPIQAKSIIAAMGGSAPLFQWNQAGKGNPGNSLALLHQAGARIENQGFMQVMWAKVPEKSFCSLPQTLKEKTDIITESGKSLKLAPFLLELLAERRTHCPASFGQRDSALDEFLNQHLDPWGCLRLKTQNKEIKIAPMAHASNGGAWIDASARTTVPGLYACGECATGMHGANRLGGAMITATQVFGHRAGEHSATYAEKKEFLPEETFIKLVKESCQSIRQNKNRTVLPKPGLLQACLLANDLNLLNSALSSVEKACRNANNLIQKLCLNSLEIFLSHRINHLLT